jgi:hypothetical protein
MHKVANLIHASMLPSTTIVYLIWHALSLTRLDMCQAWHAVWTSFRQGGDLLRTGFGQDDQSEIDPELLDLFQTG